MQNQNIYKQILDNTPEGIVVCDSSLNIIYANKLFLKLINYEEKELLDKLYSDFISVSKSTCPVCEKNNENQMIKEQFTHQGELINKQGEIIPVKIVHNNVINNNERNIITIVSFLADSVCLNQAHLDFVSTVSHELRTPLTSIKGFADTLLSAGDRLSKDQQIRFMSIIKTQVDRLTRLVEDLLTVSRLESRKDNSIYKAIDLTKLIEPIVQGIQTKALDREFKINLADNLPKIWADSDKLEQIFTNLIDNAVKYSFKNTTVTITANYTPNNTDFIDINIIDQGVGIPKDYSSQIFTKFARIDNPLTREVQGTGLGLYITKSLVEKMQGTISLNSTTKGTTFTVKMPVANCERQTATKFNSEHL